MRAILLLPTWLLLRAARPFLPEAHPFKEPVSLARWSAYANEVAVMFGILIWGHLAILTVLFRRMYLAG